MEKLDERVLLALVAPIPPGLGSAAGFILDSLPDDAKDGIPQGIYNFLDNETTLAYQAFPEERNDLSITSNLANIFMFVDEAADNIPVIRLPPAFTDDLIEEIDAGFSFIGELTLPLGKIIGVDLPDVEAIAPNPQGIVNFFPFFEDIATGIDDFLDLEFIPEISFGPWNFPRLAIPEIDLGVTTICEGGCTIIPEFELVPEVTLMEAVRVRDVLPDGVVDVLDGIADFLTSVGAGGVFVSTLDGPDKVDLSKLTGVSQTVFGGPGADTISSGGTDHPLAALGLDFIPGDPSIRLFGEGGRDTFFLSAAHNVADYRLDGGEDNDLLVINGSEANDIIKIDANGNGMVQRIQFLEPAASPTGANAIQTIALPGDVIDGEFTLSFDGDTTDIDFDASAADVQSALEALSGIDAGDVNVTKDGSRWEIEFVGGLAQQSIVALEANGANLVRSGGQMQVVRSAAGNPDRGDNEIQRVALPAFTTGGTFTLTFDDGTNTVTTDPIPAFATPAEVETALEDAFADAALADYDEVDFLVSGRAGGPWNIEFAGADLRLSDHDLLTADGAALTGGVAADLTDDSRPAEAKINEVQTISMPGGATGGTFTLTFDGHTTPPLPYNASFGDVQQALQNLPSVGGADNVVVRPAAGGGTWDVEFTGALEGQNQAAITGDAANLTGAVGVTISETQPGEGRNEVQRISQPIADSGTFRLSFNNGLITRTTDPLPYDAAVSEVRAALESLASIGGAQNIEVTGTDAGPWLVEFTNDLSATDVNQIGVIDVDLDHSDSFTTPVPPVVTEDISAIAGVNEEQTIRVDDDATGGTFTLSFGGLTTAPLSTGASAAQVQAALEQLSSIGAGNVAVTAATTSAGQQEWTVTFVNDLTNQDVGDITADDSNVSGGFSDPVSSETVAAFGGVDEQQTFSFVESDAPTQSATPTGGDYTISFAGLGGVSTSAPIDYDADADDVKNALQAMPAFGGAGADNVDVTLSGGVYTITFKDELAAADMPPLIFNTTNLRRDPAIDVSETQAGHATNELQIISRPASATDGGFTLEFDGDTTAPISYNATASEIETALADRTGLDAADLQVQVTDTDSSGEPRVWSVEFVGALANAPQPVMTADGAGLTVDGAAVAVQQTQDGSATGDKVLATIDVTEMVSVEQLQILAGGGDDKVVITGAPRFTQGVFFDGGDGEDVLEFVSTNSSPSFTAPIFPDDTQASLLMDGQEVQIADVEGGVVFDAGDNAGSATLSGTDGGDDIRFAGQSAGAATFARDGQVTITLQNFAAGSTIAINAAQGDDVISLAPGDVTEFSTFTIDGGGPAGADAVRFEGTDNADDFTLVHDAASTEAGQVTFSTGGGNQLVFNYSDIVDVSLVGRAGADSLTVNEPSGDSDDTLFFYPELGGDGSYQLTTALDDPASTQVFPFVTFQSLETRTFDLGGGVDAFSYAVDNLPGVNSSLAVDASAAGATEIDLGGFLTHFEHTTADEDALFLEIGTFVDDITVTPGAGVGVNVNAGAGPDTLHYLAEEGDVTVDLPGEVIGQVGVGDVVFTAVDLLDIDGGAGAANTLLVEGSQIDDRFRYIPLSAAGARIERESSAVVEFRDFGGDVTLSGRGGDDTVDLLGTSGDDRISLDVAARRTKVVDPTNVERRGLTLDVSIESVALDGQAGDDLFAVVVDETASPLGVQVIGGAPNASDRLTVLDADAQGDLVLHREASDRRSGSITVGRLEPIGYDGLERVDILPFDSATGAVGDDLLGRLVVFDDDPFEQNDGLENFTTLEDLAQATVRPNIDPPGVVDPFGLGFDIPGDEDWYRFEAPETGTFRFELLYEAIGELPNGNPGLPGDGELEIVAFEADGTAIDKAAGEGAASHTIGVEQGTAYFLRVRGAAADAVNVYDIRTFDADDIGPQITNVLLTDAPAYNLFAPKPETDGPTPPVDSITIRLRDLAERFPGFEVEALNEAIAENPGHFRLVGDANGVIPIDEIVVENDPVVVGEAATASIELRFAEPLPDDRFTLTVSEALVDPAGNRLDGESAAVEPQDFSPFPVSGDGVAGGEFTARFTVDSRAEVGVVSAGSVYIDTNGNFAFDPQNGDFTNRDITYTLGLPGDRIFVGDFSNPGFFGVTGPVDEADGFDKLAAYGVFGGRHRWMIDTDNNGAPNFVATEPAGVDGAPLAGNFDGDASNGDEVGLFDGGRWWFDTDRDFQVDVSYESDLTGQPIVGDFDGDGVEDVATWKDDTFTLSLSSQGGGWNHPQQTDYFSFGFAGTREKPFAANFDADRINGNEVDDIGLWVPDRGGPTPEEGGEWYVFASSGRPLHERIIPDPQDPSGERRIVEFEPTPFGDDMFGQFGDEFAAPVVGNLDPPVAPTSGDWTPAISTSVNFHNSEAPEDVNQSGLVSPFDALAVIDALNRYGVQRLHAAAVGPDAHLRVDVNGDERLSPVDALQVISYLNAGLSGEGESGEGEAASLLAGVVWESAAAEGESNALNFEAGVAVSAEASNHQSPARSIRPLVGPVQADAALDYLRDIALLDLVSDSPENLDDDLLDTLASDPLHMPA